MRALAAGALCFVAGYAFAVALHDEQWRATLCETIGAARLGALVTRDV